MWTLQVPLVQLTTPNSGKNYGLSLPSLDTKLLFGESFKGIFLSEVNSIEGVSLVLLFVLGAFNKKNP
jgi:hypothetical protein